GFKRLCLVYGNKSPSFRTPRYALSANTTAPGNDSSNQILSKFTGNAFAVGWEFPRQQRENVRQNEVMNYRARQRLVGANLTKKERDKLTTDEMRLVIARIYYQHFHIFKCGASRGARIKQQRDRVWEDIVQQVTAEGFQFNKKRIRQNFLNFISETKNKKRRTEATGAAREDFTAAEDFVILHEFAPTEEANRRIVTEDIGVAPYARPSKRYSCKSFYFFSSCSKKKS
uniref:Regulatory protein zeste n=1 Tax=Panagrolaimus sp. PS1159 TaxID=55785 RepID=A0AC35G9T0_9BILA